MQKAGATAISSSRVSTLCTSVPTLGIKHLAPSQTCRHREAQYTQKKRHACGGQSLQVGRPHMRIQTSKRPHLSHVAMIVTYILYCVPLFGRGGRQLPTL